MKKVLFVLPLPPPVHGSSMVGEYIKESKLITSSFQCRFINVSLSRDISEIGNFPFKKITAYASLLVQILKSLLVFRPDLCYMAPTARGLGFYKDFPVIVLFRLFRRETILHFHNKGITKYQGKWLDDKLYQFAFWNTKVILLSNRLYFDVEKYVSKKNTFICPNGIPGRVITKSENLATAVYLLYLSNMMKEKGVYDLLDACDSLKRKGLDFECHFVGEWSDITQKDFTREIEKKHLGNKVFVHGPKYGHEKEMFYNKANIFIFPTFNECFPLVLVEAMQYALPVISTNEGGIPDIVDNGLTGYIIEKKKLKELADRIEELMLNPTLRISMGKAGQKKFQERYTLECFEKRLYEIIITIIE